MILQQIVLSRREPEEVIEIATSYNTIDQKTPLDDRNRSRYHEGISDIVDAILRADPSKRTRQLPRDSIPKTKCPVFDVSNCIMRP